MAIRHRQYLTHKNAVREGIARRVGITKEQAKKVLLALMFGVRTTAWSENAIPKEIGLDKARVLYRDANFSAIVREVQKGRKVILQA